MKTKIILSAIFILSCTTVPTFSQDYNVGIGLRLGAYASGFTIKGNISERGAIEGIAAFGRRSFITTGLYEYHIPIKGAEGLRIFFGGGAHIGFFGDESRYLVNRHKDDDFYDIEKDDTAVIPGIDFITGVEYKFKDVPVSVGADLKPFVDFYDGPSHYVDGALNVRYVF